MKLHFIISIFLFIFIGCSLFDDDGPKDPRDYTWTLDTLKHPDPTTLQLMMNEMWASSSDDIYIVGHSSSGFGAMWHFDGDAWNPVPITETNGGPIKRKPHGINDIFGFSKDDIWAVGQQKGKVQRYDAFIIHYNGVEWSEVIPPDTSELYSVGGSDNGEIWVGPWGGGVFKYDGNKWVDGKINIPGYHGNSSYVSSFTYHKNYLPYMLYFNQEYNPKYFSIHELYKYNGVSWDYITNDIGLPWISETGTIYFGGDNVSTVDENEIKTIWKSQINHGITRIHGVSDDFLYAGLYNLKDNSGNIVFYNGKEWTILFDKDIKGIFITDIWTDGKTVVAIGLIENPKDNTIIIRGD